MRAETIARALGGRKVGTNWMAPCPAHDDRTPSLSIRDADERVLVRCHAGCSQEEVIAAMRARALWVGPGASVVPMPLRRVSRDHRAREAMAVPSEDALKLWQAAVPAGGTVVEKYFRSRRLFLPPTAALRFHTGLKHPTGGKWPSMVGLVTRGEDAEPLAVHRTFLARDGQGKAPVDPPKMMLGPCRGGAVRLAEAAGVLMIGEGIETCLAAMQATGLPAWAALSTAGLRGLGLPASVREVVVLADGDDPGEEAAQAAAQRWVREGRRVRIARPPRGLDFNDLLLGRVPEVEGGGA